MSQTVGKQLRNLADELEEFAGGWRRFSAMSKTPGHKDICLNRAEELEQKAEYLRQFAKKEAGRPLKRGWRK